MPYYATSLDHLLAEVERIDLLLRVQVWQAQQLQGEPSAFQGCSISDEEIAVLFDQPLGVPAWATVPTPLAMVEVQDALADMRQTIDEQAAASLAQGIPLRLAHLAHAFALDRFAVDVILLGLALEIDLRYARFYAYLQNDATVKRPSVDLILTLLCPSLIEKIAARQHFQAEAPLLQQQLVRLVDGPNQERGPLLGQILQVDERIVHYLLDGDSLDARLLPFAELIQPQIQLDALLLPPALRQPLAQLAQAGAAPDRLLLYLQGGYGVGKQSVANALCQAFGLKLLVIDSAKLLANKSMPFATLVRLVSREAILQQAALYWCDFDTLLADDKRDEQTVLLRLLAAHGGLSFLAGANSWEPADALRDHTFLRLEFPLPDAAVRTQLWRRALTAVKTVGTEAEWAALAGKFRFSGGQIHDAAHTAHNLACRRDPTSGQVTLGDLYAACRLQSNHKLATLAQKITPHYTWDDMVLPADRLEQLRELCDQVKYRTLVLDAWGFHRKLALGKGLNALFAGPPGTGKTMAAEIIAHELGLDLYKIDLASMVSKYIGETEKNLARLFAEAESGNAILFFDEADALFGKRSEVKDAHDRYANIEISYLLQRMEAYEGVVILATNLRKNMDDAFVRRLHFTIDFPLPAVEERRRIWQTIWPDATPCSPDLDLDFLAQRFEIAGGNIRNIALAATFLAAANGGVVAMPHLIHALRREHQKMGRVLTSAEFGAYAQQGPQKMVNGQQSTVNG